MQYIYVFSYFTRHFIKNHIILLLKHSGHTGPGSVVRQPRMLLNGFFGHNGALRSSKQHTRTSTSGYKKMSDMKKNMVKFLFGLAVNHYLCKYH